MKVTLQRQSVCMADDIDAPHETICQLDASDPLGSLLDQARDHVPKMGREASWLLEDRSAADPRPVAAISGDAKSAELSPAAPQPTDGEDYRILYFSQRGFKQTVATIARPYMNLYRWNRVIPSFQAGRADPIFFRLFKLHSQSHRHYHSAAHIDALLRHLDERRHLAERPDRIELAIWFHDAIYKPMSKSNEADSAQLAREALDPHLRQADIDWIAETILLTANHGETEDADTALMLDLDLSILATDPDVYDAYTVAIRKEYRWVLGPIYRSGRAKVLRHFLAMPRIYKRDELAAEWEGRARQNLARELVTLE